MSIELTYNPTGKVRAFIGERELEEGRDFKVEGSVLRLITRCARCRRVLTGKSAKWGMGRTCARKAPGMAERIRKELAGQMRLFPEK